MTVNTFVGVQVMFSPFLSHSEKNINTFSNSNIYNWKLFYSIFNIMIIFTKQLHYQKELTTFHH